VYIQDNSLLWNSKFSVHHGNTPPRCQRTLDPAGRVVGLLKAGKLCALLHAATSDRLFQTRDPVTGETSPDVDIADNLLGGMQHGRSTIIDANKK